MNFLTLKKLSIAVTVWVFTGAVYAADSFQAVCTNSWMKKIDESTEKVDYKNFGEKYCECAAGQPLDNEAAIQKAIQLCMSRTLLHDAMDSLEEEVGIKEAKDSDVKEYCEDKWNLVYPKQTAEDKIITSAYCACANPKLMELMKQADGMTDKQYAEGIDSAAASCSGNVRQEAPVASKTP